MLLRCLAALALLAICATGTAYAADEAGSFQRLATRRRTRMRIGRCMHSQSMSIKPRPRNSAASA